MTHLHRTTPAQAAHTTAGMLASLSNALPDPSGPLGRAARAMAHRLQETNRPVDRAEATEILAQLLDATDPGFALDDDDLLDESFDA